MSIIVQKFGGTSVADVKKIKNIADKIAKTIECGDSVVVVVSAMAGVTNQLASHCSSLSNLDTKENLAEYDVALASGEIVTSALLALALQQKHIMSRSLLSWQIPIKTDEKFSKAIISDINAQVILDCINSNIVPVIAGFQGLTEDDKITTLGRGGSDTTAVAIAASINADRCDIYTDVDGVYNADPRLIHSAKKIDMLSYEEMLEFASVGAKVLHTRSVQLGMRYNIPIRVISSFTNTSGTTVTNQSNIMEKPKVTGIAHNKNIASISIRKARTTDSILEEFANGNVNIEITHNHDDKLSVIIPLSDLPSAKLILADKEAEIRTDLALVSVIGFGVKNDTKILGIIASSLAKNDIDLLMMVTSEIKISIMIEEKYTEFVVKLLHEAMGL